MAEYSVERTEFTGLTPEQQAVVAQKVLEGMLIETYGDSATKNNVLQLRPEITTPTEVAS